jgi:diketogulonate reductase-like aldo/keto reductase
MILRETFKLANGVEIPKIGFGTWQIPQDKAEEACLYALDAGYRHIDTAEAYGNEEGVGNALKKSGIPRDRIFITSKVKAELKTYQEAKEAISKSLQALNTPYIDLMLIHAPRPWFWMAMPSVKTYYKENLEVWKAFEEAYKEGKLRSIGVSNFDVRDLESFKKHAEIQPMVNQIKFFISRVPEKILKYCRENRILVEGYSPIATGRLLKNERLENIAKKYSVSLPQLCIRYVYQRGALPLPKSVHKEHIIENSQIDFEISPDDMEYLDKLKKLVHTPW